jgi:predicted ester cyclase
MSTEQNKQIIHRLFNEGINERKFQIFDGLISDKFINHGVPNAPTGPKGFKDIVQQFIDSFSDMKIVNEEIVGDGDTVATRGYMTGTHNGTFMGIAATGKKIKMDYIDFWKLNNGKCIENWVQMDIAGVFKQIESKQFAL